MGKKKFNLNDFNPLTQFKIFQPLLHKGKNNQQQQKPTYGKETVKTGLHTYKKKKNKPGKMKFTSAVGTFFRIMLGIHPKHTNDKAKALQNADPEKVQEQRDIEAYEDGLHFPANLLTSREVMRYYRMGSPYSQIRNISWMRFLGSVASIVLFLLIALMTGKTLFVIGCIVAPILTWIAFGVVIKASYTNFTIHQQFMFDILMSVLSPYLYEMNKANANSKSGQGSVSMNAILGQVAHRIDDKRTKHSVSTLGIDVRHNPHSFAPYKRFAREFSTSPMAYMFMSSVYHMANGSTDDSAIRYLNRSSMHDLLKQIELIKNQKLKRFFTPPIIMFMDWFLLVFGYFLLFTVEMFKSNMPNI